MWPYATPGLAAAEWQLKWRLARKRKTRKASGSAGFSVLSGGDGGIRTLDASFSPHAPLAGGRISFICKTFKVFFCFFGTPMGHFGTHS